MLSIKVLQQMNGNTSSEWGTECPFWNCVLFHLADILKYLSLENTDFLCVSTWLMLPFLINSFFFFFLAKRDIGPLTNKYLSNNEKHIKVNV